MIGSGVCEPCNNLQRVSKHSPSKCHPNRPELVIGSGLCSSCYGKSLPARQVHSKCHPDRPEFVVGSGTCKVCYELERCSKHPPSKCHPDLPEFIKGSGVCHLCYAKKYHQEQPPSGCHPDRPRVHIESGLCSQCYTSKRKYGVVIDYTNHLCEICNKPLQRGAGKSAVDHNHETGAVRGILCGHCNTGLGMFGDSPDILASAIKYLHKYAEAQPNKKAG